VNESFQVRGEEETYTDILEAVGRAKKKGRGSEVIRSSDGALLATVPGWLPPTPKEE
jgi:hypothetical protein